MIISHRVESEKEKTNKRKLIADGFTDAMHPATNSDSRYYLDPSHIYGLDWP